jgi:hypothetical protein
MLSSIRSHFFTRSCVAIATSYSFPKPDRPLSVGCCYYLNTKYHYYSTVATPAVNLKSNEPHNEMERLLVLKGDPPYMKWGKFLGSMLALTGSAGATWTLIEITNSSLIYSILTTFGALVCSWISAYIAEIAVDHYKRTKADHIQNIFVEISKKDLELLQNDNSSLPYSPKFNLIIEVYKGLSKGVETYRIVDLVAKRDAFIDNTNRKFKSFTKLGYYYTPVYFNGVGISSDETPGSRVLRLSKHLVVVNPTLAKKLLLKDGEPTFNL